MNQKEEPHFANMNQDSGSYSNRVVCRGEEVEEGWCATTASADTKL